MRNKKKGHKFITQPIDGKPVPVGEISDPKRKYVLYARIYVGSLDECMNLMGKLTGEYKYDISLLAEEKQEGGEK